MEFIKSKFSGQEIDNRLSKVTQNETKISQLSESVNSKIDLVNSEINKLSIEMDSKLETKINKTDIATINGQSIIEGGDIEIEGGSGSSPIIKGNSENSAKLKGDYKYSTKTYQNNAVSPLSVAIGGGANAGLKGYYYSKVSIVNKQIALSTTQPSVITNSSSKLTSDGSLTCGYSVGDMVSIQFGDTFPFCAEIENINGNVLTLSSLPMTSDDFVLNTSKVTSGIFGITNPFEFIICSIEATYDDSTYEINVRNWNVGLVDVPGSAALAEGINTYAVAMGAHAEGMQTVAAGQFAHAEGYNNISVGAHAHAEGHRTEAGGEDSHAEGQYTKAIGDGSHVEGLRNIARGIYSHAEGMRNETLETAKGAHVEGQENVVSGESAHAEGKRTTANGFVSHTEGSDTQATASRAHAEGYSTLASGNNSHAEGKETTASGENSHSEGARTQATQFASHAEGADTQATGSKSHAEGNKTTASGNCSHAEGLETIAEGSYSHAEGDGTKAIGKTSHAEGCQSEASGIGAHAEGGCWIDDEEHYNGGIAIGNASHAEGINTRAEGVSAHAEGWDTEAIGESSHAEGYATKATNFQAHAEGDHTEANGEQSHAEGLYTIAQNSSEHAEGQYNVSNSGKTIHSVGIGTSNNKRKNAVEITNDGKHYILGIGGYDGTKLDGAQPLQNVINANINSLVNVTYNELKELRDGSALVPGKQYRITDYVTTTVQENTKSAGHQFDIIVTADDVNVLNENARAIQHTTDENDYFDNSNLAAWEIKYCLDNDTERFAWADDSDNGKGVIYYMKDEFNNECPYDFKNIQFARWELSNPVGYTKNASGEMVEDSNVTNMYDSLKEGFYGLSNTDNIFNPVDSTFIRYTISSEPTYCYTFGRGTDYSLTSENYGNVIKENYVNEIKETWDKIIEVNYITLNNIVFLRNSYNHNIFGVNCHDNTFGDNCHDNTFGNNCFDNTFGNRCTYNTFGNYYCSNTFGNDCDNNTFGNKCGGNTFGVSCYKNTFGNDCANNTFGNRCTYNTFGNSCIDNTFGSSQTSLKSYYRYIIFDNGNRSINLNCTSTTSSSKYYQNVRIGLGVNNEYAYKTINDSNVGQTYETLYRPANSQIITI